MTWLSSVLPPFALSAFGSEWLAARVAQHRVRVRFPGAVSEHARHHCDDVSRRADAQGGNAKSSQAESGSVPCLPAFARASR
jgi:hypothetical protein